MNEEIPSIFSSSDEAVNSYSDFVNAGPRVRKQMARFCWEQLKSRSIVHNNPIPILDIGIGQGDFTIPLIEYLNSRRHRVDLHALDKSARMTEKLEKRIAEKKLERNNRFKIRVDDASLALSPVAYPLDYYHAVIATFVLHYLQNWESLLNEIRSRLVSGGLFIQAASQGVFNIMSGTFNKILENLNAQELTDFWKTYFHYKKDFFVWKPAVDFTTLNDVCKYLEQIGFEEVGRKEFIWYKQLTFTQMLDWIEASPLSSIGAGLDVSQRSALRREMSDYVQHKEIDLHKPFRLYFGYEVITHAVLQ